MIAAVLGKNLPEDKNDIDTEPKAITEITPMKDSIMVAIIGAIAGVLPIVITKFSDWSERKKVANKLKRSLAVAKTRIEFLDAWLVLQERILSGEQLEAKYAGVSRELDQLRDEVKKLSFTPEVQHVLVSDRSLWQRMFLAYRPHRISGWLFRLAYYITLGILIAMTIDLIMDPEMFTGRDESGEFSVSFLVGEFIGMGVLIFVPLFIWFWLANRSERKAEKKLMEAGQLNLES